MTPEENELLTRTGPGTPMGQLFRQYWLPAMLSERLPEPDGPPVAVKLLGERLVAFRDTEGKVGLLAEFCPHRGASLAYGRNEECGLRCVYHGWKFDVTGRAVDTPAERNPDFANSVRHVAYPTREAGGIVWTYMGERAEPPPFPDFLFAKLPPQQVIGYHYRQECNYLQALEGDLDASHPSFLHSALRGAPIDERRAAMSVDPCPETQAREEPFGIQTIWRWRTGDPAKSLFWIDPFILPCHTIVPGGRTRLRWIWHAWVPIDDEHHWLYYVHYDPDIMPVPEDRARIEEAFGHDLIDKENDYRSRANLGNLHFLDRRRQKFESYTGIRGTAAQDIAIQQSMGPIVDRSREYLGSQDMLLIQLRRYLLKLARQAAAGEEIWKLNGAFPYSDIDSRMVIAPNEVSFQDVLARRDWKWGDVSNA